MKPTLRLRSNAARAAADLPDNVPDVAGLTEQRQQAVRALEQTREARRTGEIEKAAATLVNEIETGFAGLPEPGPPGVVTARVVAAGDSKAKLPAIPLAGLTARLKVSDKIVQEEETNAFGLVDLELPPAEKKEKGSYEIEVLGPSCNVLVCQKGRWSADKPAPVHLIELARSAELKPQLERAAPIEEGIRKARERAELARTAVGKALDAQERRLVEYLGEIDELLKCSPTGEVEGVGQPPSPSAQEPLPQDAPAPTAPAAQRELKPDKAAPVAQREPKPDKAAPPAAKPASEPSSPKRRRIEKNKKSK